MAEDVNAANYKLVRARIMKWEDYRSKIAAPGLYVTLMRDLYNVRNDKGSYPVGLADPDDTINAAVEHYFLCRAWIGNGWFPAWQVELMVSIYNTGKDWGVTPQHNPKKPLTPPSEMQKYFQQRGISDGIDDSILYGTKIYAPQKPEYYY